MPFPPAFTNIWDTTFPPDTQLANLLGQDLRQLRFDIMQRLSLLSGTFANRPTPEQANASWGGVGYGLLYFSIDTSQIFQWNGGAGWTDVTAQIIVPPSGAGATVASVNLLLQAAAIPQTTFYTVPVGKAGIYRVATDIILTAVGTGGTILTNIFWNNGVANQSLQTNGLATPGALGTEPPAVVYEFFAPAGTNIQHSAVFVGVTGAPTYSLRIRLEYLG